ncbi:unnamed protein product [Rhizophagus irregularis]|nr:unnamed protein product [Rhizophagus irregularis]
MRECTYNAGLINELHTDRLQFTTEPEAAAIYCMRTLSEHFDNPVGTSFLIVDCGGGTVDLTRRKVVIGGFSESKYLQTRVKQEFKNRVPNISVPKQPIAAIVRGAVDYGLNTKIIKSRVLKYTYGTKTSPLWQPGDPKERKGKDGRIYKFYTLAEKGKHIDVDEEVSHSFTVARPEQKSMDMDIYVSRDKSAKYCDEPGVELLGNFSVHMPDTHLGLNRSVLYTLRFGEMEIRATAKNKQNDVEYHTTFKLEFD